VASKIHIDIVALWTVEDRNLTRYLRLCAGKGMNAKNSSSSKYTGSLIILKGEDAKENNDFLKVLILLKHALSRPL
jgi:hypothetical protein